MKKYSLLVGFFSLHFFSVTACNNKPANVTDNSGSDIQKFANKYGTSRRILLPFTPDGTDGKNFCFYDFKWSWNAGRVVERSQTAAKVNSYPLSQNDLVSGPNGLAGFGVVSAVTTAIVGTSFCLALTAGIGSPFCFAGGAAVVAAAGSGVAAAGINHQNWANAFSNKVNYVEDSKIDSLIGTLKRKGSTGESKPCPDWHPNDIPDKSRAAIWSMIFNGVR